MFPKLAVFTAMFLTLTFSTAKPIHSTNSPFECSPVCEERAQSPPPSPPELPLSALPVSPLSLLFMYWHFVIDILLHGFGAVLVCLPQIRCTRLASTQSTAITNLDSTEYIVFPIAVYCLDIVLFGSILCVW